MKDNQNLQFNVDHFSFVYDAVFRWLNRFVGLFRSFVYIKELRWKLRNSACPAPEGTPPHHSLSSRLNTIWLLIWREFALWCMKEKIWNRGIRSYNEWHRASSWEQKVSIHKIGWYCSGSANTSTLDTSQDDTMDAGRQECCTQPDRWVQVAGREHPTKDGKMSSPKHSETGKPLLRTESNGPGRAMGRGDRSRDRSGDRSRDRFRIPILLTQTIPFGHRKPILLTQTMTIGH